MKLNYSLKNKPAVTRSTITDSTANKALFYIDKGDLIKFKTSYGDRYDFASKIYKTENLKTVFKVQSNTTNVLITNIVIEDEPYYYEVVTSNKTVLKAQDILLGSEFEVKELNGKVYTNTLITNYEISDGVFIHSSPVVHPSHISIKFYDRYILLSTPKANKADVYFAKNSTETVAEALRINDSKIELPSFYLETRSSVIKVIEGDIVYHNKAEVLPVEYNKVSPKDKLVKIDSDKYLYNYNTNALYSDSAYFTREEAFVTYTAKFSSHIFEIDTELYFKIENGLLSKGTLLDFDIKITKEVDMDGITIYSNNYLNKNKFEIKASSYGLDFNDSLTDNYKRSLTQYFTPKHIINPSKQVYISLPNKTIFQENHSNFTINKEPKENIIDYLDEDYSLKHPSLEEHSKVVVDSIKKAYYEV